MEYLNESVRKEFLDLPHDMLASLFKIIMPIESGGLEQVVCPTSVMCKASCGRCEDAARTVSPAVSYVAASGRRVVVVRSFVKKTQQTPHDEILIALKRAKEIV